MLFFISYVIINLFQPQIQPSTEIIDYYNGAVDLSNDEAVTLIEATILDPASEYEEVVARYLGGYLYENKNQNIKSITYSLSALQKVSKLDTVDNYLIWGILNNIGDALDNLHSYQEAISYYKQALKYAPLLGKKETAWTHENLGNSYRDALEAENTIKHYNQAFNIYIITENTERIAYMHYKYGYALFKAEKYDTAQYYFEQAAYDPASSNSVKGKSLKRLGMIAAKHEQYRTAYNYMNQGLYYLEGRWDYLTYLDMIEVILAAGQLKKADSLATIAYTHYDSTSQSAQDHTILLLQSQITEAKGDYKSALQLNKQYAAHIANLSDQVTNTKNTVIAAYATIILDNHAHFNKIKKNESDHLILIVIATSAIALLLIMIYLRRRRAMAVKHMQERIYVALS